MADLIITPANVLAAADYIAVTGTAGVAITAGQVLYLDSTTSTYKLADADLSVAAATVVGIALHAAGIGQPITMITQGSLNPGAALTAGKIYVLTATPGGMALSLDLALNWRTSILGVATTNSNLRLLIFNSGVAN